MIYLIFLAVCFGIIGAPAELLIRFGPRFGYRQTLIDLATDPLSYISQPRATNQVSSPTCRGPSRTKL